MPTSLLYVSRALLQRAHQNRELDDIVAVAQSRNAALGVTGALVFTGRHFAQVLEGSAAAVEELMARIRRDPRHADVETVEVAEIDDRRFAGWSMAYSGPSRYVDKHITRLFDRSSDESGRTAAVEPLIRLMQHFVEEGGVESA